MINKQKRHSLLIKPTQDNFNFLEVWTHAFIEEKNIVFLTDRRYENKNNLRVFSIQKTSMNNNLLHFNCRNYVRRLIKQFTTEMLVVICCITKCNALTWIISIYCMMFFVVSFSSLIGWNQMQLNAMGCCLL